MKKKIFATIILIMFCTLAFCQCVKAETQVKTTIQIKQGATVWTQISVSDAYDKCQELNDDNSALGKTSSNVMAHLSTNADWYAVSILTYSSYGSSSENNTTGNNSGIIDLGRNVVFTSGIFEDNNETTNYYYQSLINNKETKFVEKIKSSREQNKPGLGLLQTEMGGNNVIFGARLDIPITTRRYAFNIRVGHHNYSECDGSPGGTTFRPVIWVK